MAATILKAFALAFPLMILAIMAGDLPGSNVASLF